MTLILFQIYSYDAPKEALRKAKHASKNVFQAFKSCSICKQKNLIWKLIRYLSPVFQYVYFEISRLYMKKDIFKTFLQGFLPNF